MIVRTWRGWIRREDARRYAQYVAETGLAAYRTTGGNRGAWIMLRDEAERTEIVTISVWDSYEAIAAFAGADIERAVFYPEDDRFLVARDETATHYELFASDGC